MSTSEPNSTDRPMIDITRPSQTGALDTLDALWTSSSPLSPPVSVGVCVVPASPVVAPAVAAPAPSATVKSKLTLASSSPSVFVNVNDTTQSPDERRRERDGHRLGVVADDGRHRFP